MKFSKKLLLTQVVALAASSAAFADSGSTHKLSNYLKSGDSILQPMLSNSVNGYGVNNELFLLRQKEEGSLKDGVVYVNGRLNLAVGINSASKGSNSAVLNPGLDLAFTTTKGWFTAYADLSNTNALYDADNTNWSQSIIASGSFGAANDDGAQIYNNYANSISLAQGFLMLGDLNKMPVYMLVGRKTVDFGSFANQDQTWQPLTNLFNQGLQNQVALGFYTAGIHGAVTLFQAPWTQTGVTSYSNWHNNQLSTMVATLSYGTSVNKFGLHGGLSYTTNLNPAKKNSFEIYGGGLHGGGGYDSEANQRVSGGIIFAEVNFNPITVTANYASAMSDVNTTAATPQGKPSAWDIGAKFDFNLINRANWLSANYSETQSRGQKNLTTKQWLFGWNMAVSNNISATLQYGHLLVSGEDLTIPNTNVFTLGANLYF